MRFHTNPHSQCKEIKVLKKTYCCLPLDFPEVYPFDLPVLPPSTGQLYELLVQQTHPIYLNRPINPQVDPKCQPGKRFIYLIKV